MKLSHKLVLLSAAVLMTASPVVEASQNITTVQAKRHKAKRSHKKARRSTKKSQKNTIVLKHNAYAYLADGKRNRHYMGTKGLIGKNVRLNYFGTKLIKGVLYFNIGSNSYVKAANVGKKDGKTYNYQPAVVKIAPTVKLNHNAYEYSSTAKAQYKNGRHLKIKKGKTVKVNGLKYIGATLFYDLGHGHYIKAANADQVTGDTLKPSNKPAKTEDPKTEKEPLVVTLKADAAAIDDNGQKASTSLSSTTNYTIEHAKYFGQNLYYQVADNAWVPVSAVATSKGTALTPENKAYTPASKMLKSTLQNEVDAWSSTAFQNSDQYRLAAPAAKTAFNKALKNAQALLANPYAALNDVNDAALLLNNSQQNLAGAKVQVANLNNLTESEQNAVLDLVASANGVSRSSLKFAGNNQNIVYTNQNGYDTTYSLTDYAENK